MENTPNKHHFSVFDQLDECQVLEQEYYDSCTRINKHVQQMARHKFLSRFIYLLTQQTSNSSRRQVNLFYEQVRAKKRSRKTFYSNVSPSTPFGGFDGHSAFR